MDDIALLDRSLAGRYQIERELGRGGMATVYLARDQKHDRLVALKVLDPELGVVLGVERFLAEIKVTANLQHPNLLPLFDSGEADGLLYYVMPYVEGESLRRRLDRECQLPIDEAIRIACAVASALDYAHAHGVIHRDLKPENILLQQGQPVVADFGIALAVSNAGGQRITQTGLSLGTPQYMSPEQATGDRVIDGRTDVYSLGAVTYEMLTGEAPHHATTAQAIIAKLMTEPPRPMTVIRPAVPAHVDEAVRRALEKLPADRFAKAGELAEELRGGVAPHASTDGARVPRTRQRPAARLRRQWILLGALGTVSALVVLFAALWRRAADAPERTVRFVLDLPPDQRVATPEGSGVSISPDGRTIAYVATTQGSTNTQVYIRRIDSLTARALEGCKDANTPTFSPDGLWVACLAGRSLRKVPLSGGGAEIIVPDVGSWQNFTWSAAGDVIMAQRGSLWRVGEKGKLTLFTKPDIAGGEIGHATPLFLDDETIAFWLEKPTADGALRGVGLTDRHGGSYTVLDIPGDVPLGYVEGHLLVSNQDGTMLAYPLDLKHRRVTGPPIVVLTGAVWIPPGGLQARISNEGSLIYVAGRSGNRLVLLDARGAELGEVPELREYRGSAAMSADGMHVAAAVLRQLVGGGNPAFGDIWIWDVQSKSLARFTTDGGAIPAWSPDGKRIAYARRVPDPKLMRDVWWAPVDRSEPASRIARFPDGAVVVGVAFGPSVQILAVAVEQPGTKGDIYLVNPTTPNAAPVPLVQSAFDETQPSISPDGRLLAYVSDESGRAEIYVRPLGAAGAPVKITTGGASAPEWGRGDRLIYTTESGQTVAATIASSASSLVVARLDTIDIDGARMAVEPHTDRILVTRPPPDRRIVVVSNWLAELRAKLKRGGA